MNFMVCELYLSKKRIVLLKNKNIVGKKYIQLEKKWNRGLTPSWIEIKDKDGFKDRVL